MAQVPDLGPVLLRHRTPQAPALALTLGPKLVRTPALTLGPDRVETETGDLDLGRGRGQDMVRVLAGEAALAAVKDMERGMGTARGMVMGMTAKTEIKNVMK